MESRSEIVQKLLYVAEHKEKCFDFDTQLWLEKYEKRKNEQTNFSEAAFLVFSAAKIYGHKVDYLEQMLFEFNRSSIVDFQATAKTRRNADANGDGDKCDDAKGKASAADKAKEKQQRRHKRLLQFMSKIEFNPKEFTVNSHPQLSLNIHEQRADVDDEYEQFRLKNVFPRINILQSNLQNNSSFYDILCIIEKNCDNLDALRDFRIFMDTIDEPFDLGEENEECNTLAVRNRGHEKHFNAYLSAEHIKEKYGVDMPDNSDYLNMLKYGEEIERLNLRQLTIEQLGQLKVGTYLNNILHGNQQDCIIPEADSGMGESICDSGHEQSTLVDTTLNTTSESSDQSGSDPGTDHSMIETDSDQSLNKSETSMEVASLTDTLDADAEVSALNESFEDKFDDLGGELDDGTGAISNTSVQLDKLDDFERSMLNPVVEMRDIFFPMNKFVELSNDFVVDLKDPMNHVLVPEESKLCAPILYFNIFQIDEAKLRKPKLFQLTEEFDLWVAARKRKSTCADDSAPRGKMLKLSTGAMVRTDPDSDNEELLGFDEQMTMRTARRTPVSEGSITSESFIITEKTPQTGNEVNAENTSVDMGNCTMDAADQSTLNISSDQSTLNISGEQQAANSTEICNGTFTSTNELVDSGFDELFESTENGTMEESQTLGDLTTTLVPPLALTPPPTDVTTRGRLIIHDTCVTQQIQRFLLLLLLSYRC